MLKRSLLLGSLIVGFSAIAGPPRSIEFQVIADLGFRSSKAVYAAINSQAELATLWKARNTYSFPEKSKSGGVPRIDFDRFTLLVASAGTKPNGGFSLVFASVRKVQGMIIVSVLDVGPGNSCPTTQEITNPKVFALIQKSSDHVEFIVSHVTVDCASRERIA